MEKAGERISEEVVVERTGKTREQWFALLDEWGAAERSHGEIARRLNEQHGVRDGAALGALRLGRRRDARERLARAQGRRSEHACT